MAYSFTWLYAALAVSLILTFIATFICFYATGYLTSTTSASVNANHTSARSFLLWSGVTGIFIILLLLFSFYNIYTKNVNDMSPIDVINQSYFGAGTLILALLIFFLIVFMLFFMIYAISLVDPVGEGNSARWLTIGASVMMIIVLILSLVSSYMYIAFNSYLTALLTEPVENGSLTPLVVAPVVEPSQGSLNDIIYFSRNPNKKGRFDGSITLKGTFKNDPQYTTYNGQIVEDLESQQTVPVNVTYRLEESIKSVTPVTPVVVTPVVSNVPRRQVAPVVPIVAPVVAPRQVVQRPQIRQRI